MKSENEVSVVLMLLVIGSRGESRLCNMDMVKTDQILTYAARLGMECKDIKWLLGQHRNYIIEMKQKVKAAGSNID
jgi:hypothetical protein